MSIKLEYEQPVKPKLVKVVIELDEKDFLLFGAICGKLPSGNRNAYDLFMKACDHFGTDKVLKVFTDNTNVYMNVLKFCDR